MNILNIYFYRFLKNNTPLLREVTLWFGLVAKVGFPSGKKLIVGQLFAENKMSVDTEKEQKLKKMKVTNINVKQIERSQGLHCSHP